MKSYKVDIVPYLLIFLIVLALIGLTTSIIDSDSGRVVLNSLHLGALSLVTWMWYKS